MISSTAITADLLRRGADGTWPEAAARVGAAAALTLDSIGLELPLAAAYRTTDLV